MNKFTGIISDENIDVVVSVLNAIEIPERDKINLIESICNIVYVHEKHFDKFSVEQKVNMIMMVTFVFDSLLDKEINPLSSKLILKGLNCFNNNIFGEAKINA